MYKMDDKSLLIEQFQHFNIEIYGTFQNPLFKAKDIGDLLGIKNIRTTIDNFDDECKIKINVRNHYGASDTWFLTEDGLYEVLFVSRKPIAKEFKRWIRELIKNIRLNSQKKLEEEKQELQKQLEYYKENTYIEVPKEEYKYILSTDIEGIIKIGKTINEPKKRRDQQQTNCVNDVKVLFKYQCNNSTILEKVVHHILDKYRHSSREHFNCNLNYAKMIIKLTGKFIDVLSGSFQNITEEELTKHLESKVNIEEVITKKIKKQCVKCECRKLDEENELFNEIETRLNQNITDELIEELKTPLIQEIKTTYY